jgi:hypothetical protein
MAVKLKKSVKPIGTKHYFPIYVPGVGLEKPIYSVYDIHGDDSNQPSGGVTVFLKYAGPKPAHVFPPTACITLNFLASDCEAVTAEDVFWTTKKTDA